MSKDKKEIAKEMAASVAVFLCIAIMVFWGMNILADQLAR